jgi:hypothetical protein
MSGQSIPLEDFMPAEEQSSSEPQELTPEQMAAKIDFVMQQLGGRRN